MGVVRALGQSGIGVELITIGKAKDCYVSSSRYVKKHHALTNIKELAAYLMYRINSDSCAKEIVISCADAVTEHLNLHRERLCGRYILPGCEKQGMMVHLMDKTTMIKMASQRGIHAPTVWKLPEERDKVTFPCITKSYVSSYGGKADVKILQTKNEFNAFLKDCKDEIFVQPFILKKEEVQFIGCSLKGGEEIIIPGMTHIIRSQPNTNTGFLEYGPIDSFYAETVMQSKQYIKDCGYSGLFSIEFLRSQDDKVYFLEINFRNDGNAWCVTAAGVNLPVIWVKANSGIDYSDEIREPKRIFVRKVNLSQWLKDWRRTDAFLDWNKKDKKPFFRFILNKL